MNFFYTLGVHLIALGSLLRSKSRPLFFRKLGRDFPALEGCIWVHAVSLGETKAVAPLIKRLKTQKHPPKILLTTGTRTGHEEGKRSAPEADAHLFLPFDFPYLLRPLMRRIRPRLIILSETDFWLHFQRLAKEQGALVCLVNGKLSERSFRRFARVPKFAHKLLGSLDCACVQSALYANRFQSLGLDPSKIHTTGNLKFDGLKDAAALELGWSKDALILTLGSTHAPEEAIWLQALTPLLEEFPKLRVALVPRHPERFEAVARLLDKEGYAFNRFSSPERGGRILLVDAMGLLCRCFRQSTLAFVGGSLAPGVGGHNILEPARYGVPVLYGPHMEGQAELARFAKEYEVGLQVTSKTLTEVCRALLIDPAKRAQLGQNGLRLMKEAAGSLEKTYVQISGLLEKSGVDRVSSSSRDGAVVSSLGS